MKNAVAAVVIALVFSACSGSPVEQNNDPPALTLSADSVAVSVGASAVITATLRNTSEQAQFVSRDQSVATVNSSGVIKGVGVGSTYVVATLSSGDVRDSVRVRVQQAPGNADTCGIARPEFGVASDEERELFSYDANAPLNLVKTVESSSPAAVLYRISYTSPAGGLVTGIMAEPVGRAGLRPGIVIMHPSGNPTSPVGVNMEIPNAQWYAQHGAVVIAIDAPFVRRLGTATPLFTEQDRFEQIQLMKDLRRAVDVLRERDDVDVQRIGFIGYSYGAIMGAQFVAVERRIKAGVLAAGNGGHVTNSTTSINIGYLSSFPCGQRNAWLRAMTPVEPIRFIPFASSTQLLFQIGKFDTAVFPVDAKALYDAASDPKEVVYYDTGHSLNQQALKDRHNWLSEKIGMDPWI